MWHHLTHSVLKHDSFSTLQYRICGTTELNLQPYWFVSLNLVILFIHSNFECWVYQTPSQFVNKQFEFKHKKNNGNTKFITFKVNSQKRPFKGCVWHIYCSDNDYWLKLLVDAHLVTASHLQPAVIRRIQNNYGVQMYYNIKKKTKHVIFTIFGKALTNKLSNTHTKPLKIKFFLTQQWLLNTISQRSIFTSRWCTVPNWTICGNELQLSILQFDTYSHSVICADVTITVLKWLRWWTDKKNGLPFLK